MKRNDGFGEALLGICLFVLLAAVGVLSWFVAKSGGWGY